MPVDSIPTDEKLVDGFGRKITYLRISITDLCNLRCFYCMPTRGVKKLPQEDILRYEEILEVAEVAAGLGIKKMRLTGGEPLVKRGAVKMVREIKALRGVETVAMTTNGTRLEKYAVVLGEAGLSRVNISLDTLDADHYRRVTRGGDLHSVLRGIDKALEVGFRVKVNAVLTDGLNLKQIHGLVDFTIDKQIELRFIERMSFEGGDPFVPQNDIIEELQRTHSMKELETESRSPHVRLFDCSGVRLGFISPRSHPFCEGCNKLRLTPIGELRACLASQSHVDIRAILRRPHERTDVVRAFQDAVSLKPEIGPWEARAEMWRVGG